MFDKIPALAGQPRRLEELSGGLTNRNVKITTPDAIYVARCTDKSSNMLGIDRDRACHNTRAARTGRRRRERQPAYLKTCVGQGISDPR